MLEPTALAIRAGRCPDVKLAELAAHGEETEDQERNPAIAVGLDKCDPRGITLGHEFDGLAIVRPERWIERRVLDNGHREAMALADVLEPRLAFDRSAVPAIPGQPDQCRPLAAQRLG